MKRTQILSVLAVLSCLAPAVLAAPPPIAAFGETGDAVPEIVRSFLPRDFFTTPMTEALASGENYSASVAIPRRGAEIVLKLRNLESGVTDVALSADRAGVATNFIVRLEAGESVRVDAGELAGADRLYLLALGSFAAKLEVGGAGRERQVESLKVLPPVAGLLSEAGGKLTAKSGSCATLTKKVCICNEASECVTAWAKRRVLPHLPDDPPFAELKVFYPTSTSAYHCPAGSTELDPPPYCTGSGYGTYRCDGTPYTHFWSGIDDTVMSCAESYASCTSGCSGSFTVNCC